MRICIDTSPALHHRGGIGRYVQELVPSLRAADPGGDYLGLCDRAGRAAASVGPGDVSLSSHGLSDRAWRLLALLSLASRIPADGSLGQVDIFHATDNVMPRTRRVRTVFTLHDLAFRAFPQTHGTLNRCYLEVAMGPMLRAADAVIAVSEATARDAMRYYGVPDERLHVVYNGVDARFCPSHPEEIARVRQSFDLPAAYLLFVGTIEPRKNLVALLEAYATLCAEGAPPPLAIVGKRGWRSEPFYRARSRLGLENKVRLLGMVSDSDLVALYSGADAFVWPSLYEGFGFPVLEAMACGAPVICSDAASLPEVAGNAAIVAPANDRGALVDAMRRILQDQALRSRLKRLGLRRAAEFTWERTAHETLQVYEHVYAHKDTSAHSHMHENR